MTYKNLCAAGCILAAVGSTICFAEEKTQAAASQTAEAGAVKLVVGNAVIEKKTYPNPIFQCGNKELRVLDQGMNRITNKFAVNVRIYVKKKEALSISWFGGEKGMKVGWPFEDNPEDPGNISVNEQDSSFTIVKNYKSADGVKQFHLNVRLLSDNRIEVSWDKRTMPHFNFSNYRAHGLTIGGKPVPLTDPEALLKTKKTRYNVSGPIEFFAGNKEENFSIDIPGLTCVEETRTVVPKWKLDRCNLATAFIPKEMKLIIDLSGNAPDQK